MRIARELIDPDADKVVRRLARHGFKAYLVGGCVRDLLLGRTPKDFDVATSATPKEIKQLFRNCRIIGRRFRLAHIFFGGKIIETSTFRANPRQGEDGEDGELLIRRDNVFGSDTEDAQRRDFTINGLFYDVEAARVIDHVGGLQDLESRVINTIGDPDIRFREDPVRMLRAIKFAARLGFSIAPDSYAAILRHRDEIGKSAQPRVLEELYRLLRSGAARRSMELLLETGVAVTLSAELAAMFVDTFEVPDPQTRRSLEGEEEAAWAATWAIDAGQEGNPAKPEPPRRSHNPHREPVPALQLSYLTDPKELAHRRAVAWRMLDQLDGLALSDGDADGDLSNALIVSSLCAPFLVPALLESGIRPFEANEMVLELLQPLVEQLRVARRDAERSRQILLSQRRLAPARRRRGKPMALVRREYFEDALTLYEVYGAAADRDTADASYWRKLQAQGGAADGGGRRQGKRRRRRRGGRRRRRTPVGRDRTDADREPAAGTP